MRSCILSLTCVLAAGAPAFAQPGMPTRLPNTGGAPSPALSPYLNITGRGGNPAVNYYLGTLTEFDRRAFQSNVSNQGMTQSLLLPQPLLNFDEIVPDLGTVKTLSPTGHQAVYNMYGSFYQFNPQQRAYFPLNLGTTGSRGPTPR